MNFSAHRARPPPKEPPMSHRKQFFLLAILSLALWTPARAGVLPTYVGACVKTRIKSIETRLEGVPGSGSADRAFEGRRPRADVSHLDPAPLPERRQSRPCLPHYQFAHAMH